MSTRAWIVVIAAMTLAIFMSACASPNPQPPGLTPIPTLAPGATLTLVPALQATPQGGGSAAAGPADPALGVATYLENCSPCHGREGEGVDSPALRNNRFIQTAGDPTILKTIAGGVPGSAMPAWLQSNGGPLTDAEINNVIAYLHKLQNVPPLPKATPLPPEPTEPPPAPGAPTPEPARPSQPGGPGPAATLTGDATRGKALFGKYCAVCHGPEGIQGLPNPDSDDGSVPPLNPIDPTIANPNPQVFAANVDVFMEHGSTPEGSGPLLRMPAFGDRKMLTDQEMADIIAYVISLNK
jgi:mono/diheme cytochrome c family protein